MAVEIWKRNISHSFNGNGGYWVGANKPALLPQNHTGYQETSSERGSSYYTRRRRSIKRLRRLIRTGIHTELFKKQLHRLLRVDSGNSFRTVKTAYADNSERFEYHGSQSNPAVRRHFDGKLFAYNQNTTPQAVYWPVAEDPSDSDLNFYGAAAIRATLPLNPLSSAATGLAELIRDTPRIPGRALFKGGLDLRNLAGEFLNLEFALKPFLNDIKETQAAVLKSQKVIDQLARDSGRLVRRRFEFPVTTEVSSVDLGLKYPSPIPNSYYPWYLQRRLILTTTVTKKYVFSGAYTYLFPKGDSMVDRFRRNAIIAHKLYGVSPEVMWELTPWSWAADWVANIGTVLSNITSMGTYGQVLVYGYIQCETRVDKTYTLGSGTIPSIGQDLFQTFSSVRKVRKKATPFGFGLDPDSFTGKQWAIIAALGISQDWQRLRHG